MGHRRANGNKHASSEKSHIGQRTASRKKRERQKENAAATAAAAKAAGMTICQFEQQRALHAADLRARSFELNAAFHENCGPSYPYGGYGQYRR